MVKSELIKCIMSKFQQLPEDAVEKGGNQLLEHMSETLSAGTRIEVRGFGGFSLRHHPARNGRNPRTGKKVISKPKYVVHFKPGKHVRERINESRFKNIPIIKP